MKQLTPNVCMATWSEAREKVVKSDAALARILDDCRPGNSHKLILASYPFGDDFLTPQQFCLPNGETSKQILKELDYGRMPLGLLLDKKVEVYYETRKRIVSDKILSKGSILGVWELLDSQIDKNTAAFFRLSAGSRSIFILPKISDKTQHGRMCKQLNINVAPPSHLRDHRDIFSTIIKTDGDAWRCEILYFGKEFAKAILENPAFYPLKNYLFIRLWEQSYNCRQQFELNISWEDILDYLSRKNIHIKPYLLSHIKQIVSIAEGVFPGLVFAKPAERDFAPVQIIRETYKTHYRLKNYEPVLMVPDHINNTGSVYYSLNFPNYFEPMLPISSDVRIMDDLKTINLVLSSIQGLVNQPKFKYRIYHSNPGNLPDINPAINLVSDDEVLNSHFQKIDKNRFAYNGPFFKGCIKISDLC